MPDAISPSVTAAVLSLTTTVASREDAERLARGLVARRLAACVQVEALVQSVYRWDAQVCSEPELRLVVKTVPERLEAIRQFMAEQHPYELPQLTWELVHASAAYEDWIRSEATGSEPGTQRT